MTLIKNAYESVVLTLDDDDMRIDIPRRTIENLLSVEIGAIKPGTLERHVTLMCDLGYIVLSSRGYGRNSLKYDIVYDKVLAIRKRRGD